MSLWLACFQLPVLQLDYPSPARPANKMKRLGLRDKRVEVQAQLLSVRRERERTAKNSGVRGLVEGGSVGESFLGHPEGYGYPLPNWRIIMATPLSGGQVRNLVGRGKLL